MTKAGIWFFLSCKRYIRRLSFLAILLLLPLGAVAARHFQEKGEQGIRIAVALEGEDALAQQLVDSLVNRSREGEGGMFRFYRCEDEQRVEAEVAARRAECGFVIYEGFQEKLDSGSFRRTIGVYSAPSTVAAALSEETVFGALMEIYNGDILERYVEESDIFYPLGLPGSPERGKVKEEAAGLYGRRLRDGSAFRFEYSYLGQENGEAFSGNSPDSTVFPLRGLAAVYLFITSLYAGVVLGEDEKKGLFLPLSYGHRLPCALASLAAPVVMAASSALLALWAGGSFGAFGREFGVMACYCLGLVILSWGLKVITPGPQILCAVIPFFIIGSLLFCPVFIDGGRLVKGIDQVGRLFPPWHYLHFFSV